MSIQPDILPTDLFDDLRQGFSFVADHADHVAIDQAALENYARNLPPLAPENIWDSVHHFSTQDPEILAAYVLILDAANFGSGYVPDLKREGWEMKDGFYYTVATALKYHFTTRGLIRAHDLAQIEPEQVAVIFGLNIAKAASRDFAQKIAGSWQDMGKMIMRDSAGSYWQYVQDAQGQAQNMVKNLIRLPHFQDVHDYKGRPIAFYKRAQITAADLHLAFTQVSTPLFETDLHRLTCFADNGVPHVLHADGILRYKPALEDKITRGEELPSGCAEEIEIRALAAEAVERIAAIKGLTPVAVDHILWHRHAEDPRYKDHPTHRTKSVFY